MKLDGVGSWLSSFAGAIDAALAGSASPELSALFAGAGLLALLVGTYSLLGPSVFGQRLRRYVAASQRANPATRPELRSDSPMMMEMLERRLARRRLATNIRTRLLRAGLSINVAEFFALRLLAALVIGVAVGTGLAFSLGMVAVLAALLAGLAGCYLPSLVISILAKRRMAALEKQIPDALDSLASSLQAGSGLAHGLALLAREMRPPMSVEIRQVLQEIGLGLSMQEALTNLSNRVFSEDLDLVVTSIIIQMRVGGNLAHILRTTANVVRERMVLRGEIQVLTAQQRFSSLVIMLLPPGVAGILWLVSTDYMAGILATDLTRFLLGLAVLMQLSGMFMMDRITRIEV